MNFINHTIHRYPTVRRLTRFMSVGAVATCVDLVVFSLLHFSFGFSTLAANTISYGAGSINSFSLHRIWTYADRPQRALGVQLIQFLIVALGALLINDLVMYVAPHVNLINLLPDNDSLIDKFFATGAGMVWNFFVNYFWTFRKITH